MEEAGAHWPRVRARPPLCPGSDPPPLLRPLREAAKGAGDSTGCSESALYRLQAAAPSRARGMLDSEVFEVRVYAGQREFLCEKAMA